MPPPAPVFWKKVDENQVSYLICIVYLIVNVTSYLTINYNSLLWVILGITMS